MYITLYIPKINLTLFLNELNSPFSKITMEESFLTFKSMLDGSNYMSFITGYINVLHLENEIVETIVSDFSQLIEDYEESNDNDYNDIINESTNEQMLFKGRRNRVNKRKSIIRQSIHEVNININSHLYSMYFHEMLQYKVISNIERFINCICKKQLIVDMIRHINRDKHYKVILDGLKFLIRLDTIYLLKTFLWKAFLIMITHLKICLTYTMQMKIIIQQ